MTQTTTLLNDDRIIERVEAGACWLDQHHPDWFVDVAKAMAIDAEKPFTLARAEACVLGTVFGDYHRVLRSFQDAEVAAEWDAMYPLQPLDVPLLDEDEATAFGFCFDQQDVVDAAKLMEMERRALERAYGNGSTERTRAQSSTPAETLAWLRLEFWWRLAVADRLGMLG